MIKRWYIMTFTAHHKGHTPYLLFHILCIIIWCNIIYMHHSVYSIQKIFLWHSCVSNVKSRRANNNKINDFLIPFRCSGSKSLLLHMSPSWLTRIINGTKPSLMLLATLVRFMLNNESNVCWGKKGGLCVHAGSAGALTWDKALMSLATPVLYKESKCVKEKLNVEQNPSWEWSLRRTFDTVWLVEVIMARRHSMDFSRIGGEEWPLCRKKFHL